MLIFKINLGTTTLYVISFNYSYFQKYCFDEREENTKTCFQVLVHFTEGTTSITIFS